MKKVSVLLLVLIMALSLCSCGCENESAVTPSEEGFEQEEMATIIPNDVPEGSVEDLAVRETVKTYLDTFISCDFEAIKAQLHPDDAWLFNFELESQMQFYETIFPLIEYEFEYVSEHEGVYGVMTRIISPNMAHVYGSVITDYIDTSIAQDEDALRELVDSNTERMLKLVADPETPKRDEKLYIYVEYIDGEYVPRCNFYLANELTGGAPEASDELTSTINSSVEALSE